MTNSITVRLDTDTLAQLEGLLAKAKSEGTMLPESTIEDLLTYAAETLATGMRRPGSWEGEVVGSMFGL